MCHMSPLLINIYLSVGFVTKIGTVLFLDVTKHEAKSSAPSGETEFTHNPNVLSSTKSGGSFFRRIYYPFI